MLANEILSNIAEKFKIAGLITPRFDAEILVAHALNTSREKLFLNPNHHLNEYEIININNLVQRRLNFEPIAYIIGHKEFWDSTFIVNSNVLIPRSDSEAIIQSVVDKFIDKIKSYTILDLCTGSGCLGLTIGKIYTNSTVDLIDVSDSALKIAALNADKLCLSSRVKLINSDWFNSIPNIEYDIIMCNPPYIAENAQLMPDVYNHEPHLALFGKDNGLANYKILAANLKNFMHPQSIAFLEIGKGQKEYVEEIFNNTNYKIISFKQDLANICRVICIKINLG